MTYVTLGGLEYEELAGSPTFSATPDGMSATQIYKMGIGGGLLLADESFPAPVQSPCGFEFNPTRKMPGFPWLHTKQIDVEGFDPENPRQGTQHNFYAEGERVTIEYQTSAENEDVTVLTHRVGIGGEFMQMPSHGLKWSDQAPGETVQEEDVGAAKVIPTVEHELTFNWVPDPPFDKIVAKIGMVNGLTNLFNATPETLMFIGADADRNITSQGADAWKVVYRFSQRVVKMGGAGSIGWNHFFRPSDGIWKKLQDKNGNDMYESTTFSDLFGPAGCPT